jgi:hypothetical protein
MPQRPRIITWIMPCCSTFTTSSGNNLWQSHNLIIQLHEPCPYSSVPLLWNRLNSLHIYINLLSFYTQKIRMQLILLVYLHTHFIFLNGSLVTAIKHIHRYRFLKSAMLLFGSLNGPVSTQMIWCQITGWLVIWKGFERKRSWSNRNTIPAFA